jgi:hypothetical protein
VGTCYSNAPTANEDENGSGRMDPLKRAQLIDARPHVIIPDFRDTAALMDTLIRE